MRELAKQDKEFLIDLVKISADRYWSKSEKKLSSANCILLACRDLGYSITPTQLSLLTYHIERGTNLPT